MAKYIRSKRGVAVDFDKLRIMEQIANAPKSVDVKRREDFVFTKANIRKQKMPPKSALLNDIINSADNDSEVSLKEKAAPRIKRTKKQDK